MSDELLDGLARHFREHTRPRLREMAELLDALDRNRADPLAFDQLAHHFHGLAGLGTTYGFPRVSDLAGEGEDDCIRLSRAGAAPEVADVTRWRELTAGIARELC